MGSEFVDRLTMILYPYVNGEQLQEAKMKIDMLCHDYKIEKASTDLVPYQGDVNEKVLFRFLESKLAMGGSKRTIKYYKDTIRYALQTIGKPYDQVTAEDIRYYLAIRVAKDSVSKTTANNERRNLSSFFGWLQKQEILLKNPMSKVDIIKVTKKKKKAFSQIEIEKIRAGCKTNREKMIVEVLFSTWCRVSELVEIKISDIHDGKCTVHGKGDKYREVYINAKAQVAIEAYLTERKDSNPYLLAKTIDISNGKRLGMCRKYKENWYQYPDYVHLTDHASIGSIEALVRNLGKRIGVENVHPHRFRRTGATMALRAGMPLLEVSKLLGHESVETTQIYLDITDEELEQAHLKYVV